MKITKLEKKEYEEVWINSKIDSSDSSGYEGVKYIRENGKWSYGSANILSADKEFCNKLEAAYQRYKNPPFKIEVHHPSYNWYYLILKINGIELQSRGFQDKEEGEKAKQKLEQVLNSLLEGEKLKGIG